MQWILEAPQGLFWTVLGSLFGALWGRLRAVFGCKGRFEGSFWVDFGYVLSFFSEAPTRLGVLLCLIWNALGGVACQNTWSPRP